MDISVVIPVFNEEKNISILHGYLRKVLDPMRKKYEIIFVDDGSTDNTFKELSKLKRVKIIKFRKNYGQTSAMAAGFREAKGRIIVSMDADLQNDCRDIPLLVDKLNEGYDVVSGWRFERSDNASKKLFSRFANWLRRFLISEKIHDSGCSLKAYRKECFYDIDLYGDMHRYIPALLGWKGFRITEVKVRHHPRRFGETKYGFVRIIHGFMDLVNVWFWRKYSSRPLHIFGGLGLILTNVGILIGLYASYLKIFRNIDLSNTFMPVVAVFLVIVGVLFFISGLMADIMIKNYYSFNGRKPYSVEKIVRK